MPKYFFNVINSDDLSDHDGTDCADLAEMRSHAAAVKRELKFRRDGMLGHTWADWTMQVRNEAGEEVYSLAFSDANGS